MFEGGEEGDAVCGDCVGFSWGEGVCVYVCVCVQG